MLINKLPLFMPDGAGGSDPAPTPAATPTPAAVTQEPAKAEPANPAAEPANTGQENLDTELKKFQKELEKAQKKLEGYEKAEKDRADAEKTAAEKLAEREKELAETKRENLITKVRMSGGFTDSIFNTVNPTGETEDEIKEAFEAHKATLDEYVKAQGGKPGQGGATNNAANPKDTPTPENDNRPYLVRAGIVKQKQAV